MIPENRTRIHIKRSEQTEPIYAWLSPLSNMRARIRALHLCEPTSEKCGLLLTEKAVNLSLKNDRPLTFVEN